MGRPPLSSYPPEVAAKMRADLSAKKRAAWARGAYANRVNGALQAEVQERIAESVRKRWEEGAYENRTNGMTGMTASSHPGWAWGKPWFRDIYFQFEERVCSICGCTDEERKIDVHHIDEDHNNYLLSNLTGVCVPCHMWRYHYKNKLQPFVTISKRFAFEYAHVLPWHPGKCGTLHGHSGHLEVFLRARLDPHGVVEDFYDVGQICKAALVDKLDHKFLNDFLPNPTSEELLVYCWIELERAGLKGLTKIAFSETDSSTVSIDIPSMLDAFGWDQTEGRAVNEYFFVQKPSSSLGDTDEELRKGG